MMLRPATPRVDKPMQRGFTLIEIMIVVAITGTLASVGGTQYSKFIDKARAASAIAEMQAISRLLDGLQIDDGELPETLVGIEAQGDTDPWGNPYQYLKIAGTLPAGLAQSVSGGLPHVAAPPQAPDSGGGGGEPPTQPRMDRFLVPINTDYDLYSKGADGDSERQLDRKVSRDDVIRAANGTYFGLAENF